ncbi:hypothetical protein TWF718_004979 [Orbilia javanica]|uniref:Uncharacterized protein n=1 Tax=Orbilia javanica TaxID=47235 RepID=A0AAN8RLI8_9PEZI
MTRPVDPLYPSHPAHIVHHQHCNHILRRVYKTSPDDPSQTGCICSQAPEGIVRPICLERGGVPCRIDELTYEIVSLPIECNYCAERSSSMGSEEVSSESEMTVTEEDDERGVKSGGKSKGKGRTGGKVQKRVGMSDTLAARLAVGFGGLEIQSPSSTSSGSDFGRKGKKGGSKRKSKGSLEETVWKQLRSGPVGGF